MGIAKEKEACGDVEMENETWDSKLICLFYFVCSFKHWRSSPQENNCIKKRNREDEESADSEFGGSGGRIHWLSNQPSMWEHKSLRLHWHLSPLTSLSPPLKHLWRREDVLLYLNHLWFKHTTVSLKFLGIRRSSPAMGWEQKQSRDFSVILVSLRYYYLLLRVWISFYIYIFCIHFNFNVICCFCHFCCLVDVHICINFYLIFRHFNTLLN